MADVDFTSEDREELFGRGVYSGVGDRLGTVGGVDEDANALIVAPNPGRIEEGWTASDEDTAVGFDANWLGVADESFQSITDESEGEERDADAATGDGPVEGVSAGPPDPEEVPDADEWPYTVVPADVDEIDEDGVHLKI